MQTGSRPLKKFVLLLGALVTLSCFAMQRAGLFERPAHMVLDWQYAHARWEPEPLDPRICHVDIDDSSLANFGRWSSWDRSRIALVIDELSRAGARTIALDLILSDRTISDDAHSESSLSGHDETLSRSAQESDNLILGVDLHANPLFAAPWESQPESRNRLIELLSNDITLDRKAIVQRAALPDDLSLDVLSREMTLKAAAVSRIALRALQSEAPPASFEEFRRRLAPTLDELTGEFPEKLLLERAWEQAVALQLWRENGFILPAPESLSLDATTPYLELAKSAAGTGFLTVTFDLDEDDAVRRIAAIQSTSAGAILPFALGAAAQFLGEDVRHLEISADAIGSGDRAIPIHDGRIVLDWPTTPTDWLGVFRSSDSDPPSMNHISIGGVLSLGQQRQRLERLESEFAALSVKIARDLAISESADRMVGAVRDEVTFQLDSIGDDDAIGALTTSEREAILPFLQWRTIDREVQHGREVIAEASRELQEAVDGKLVFLGWTATGGTISDVVRTPLAANTPGVVVHAVLADMFLSGRYRTLAPPWLAGALVIATGVALTLIAANMTPVLGTFLAWIPLGGYLAYATFLAFQTHRLILPIAEPFLSGATVWIASIAMIAIYEQRERLRLTRQFKARVSPELMEYMLNNPGALSVAGEQREVTVLFLDLAGFTAISESLDGQTTVMTLNRFMKEMTRVLTHEGAYVNKFLGDGLMAFWSAFRPDPQQATRATRAAIECHRMIEVLNDIPEFENTPRLAARIGIATGRVIVGDCGAPPDLNDYTVIGDTVNLASRLESANKQLGSSVLIDGRTRELIDDPSINLRALGHIVVVGQSKPVAVFEPLGAGTDESLTRQIAHAVELFENGDVAAARDAWSEIVRQHGASKLADRYFEAIDQLDEKDLSTPRALRLREK